MAGATVANELLERLAAVRLDGDAGRVISAYLNLDPSRFATAPARASEIDSLLDGASREIRACEGLSHQARVALNDDLERLRAYFANEFSADGARGMALFAAAPAGLFEAVPLSRPVDTEVTLDVAPRLGPLLDERPEASWLVVLINSREARLLGGWIEHLVELDQWHEDVHGRQATGGWSQARYERSEEGEAAAHVRKSLARLAKLPWHTRYQHVLVATTPELREHVERDLDSTVRERLAGVVERDLLGEPPDAVLSELRPEMEKREREDEEELLARMRDGIATRGRAVGGLDDVLFALAEQRVETLLIAPGLKRPGVRCHRDGWMASGEEPDAPTTCPLDGTPLERRADIVEDALAAAVRSSAHIVPIRWHEDALGPIGGVAALLRF